jgi:anthranilate phosphoribosyltransferase
MAESPDVLQAALKSILEQHATLSRDRAHQVLDTILDRSLDTPLLFQLHVQIAALLGALAARGETVEELAGFVDALRARVTRIPLTTDERSLLVDTCGTGGDLSGTFNISTAAALVAAAAGARVAKHGNRAVTSKCGSADVLDALGIAVDLDPAAAAEALRTHRFAFLPAPLLQPAMKSIMPIRRAFAVRTAFNILGPMTNPAGAQAQVLGVYAPHLVRLVAETLARLDTRHAFVVHGGGMDEFSISGATSVAEVKAGEVRLFSAAPADFGLSAAPIETLAGGDARTNAAILRAIFAGELGPRRDVVVMNAAAVLVTANLAEDFLSGARLAQDTIDAGKVVRLVESLAAEPRQTR